jgi:hypothetical protein
MVIDIVVDTVAPGLAPPIRLEKVFKHGRRVVALFEVDDPPEDNQVPSRMIGTIPSSLKRNRLRLSRFEEIMLVCQGAGGR